MSTPPFPFPLGFPPADGNEEKRDTMPFYLVTSQDDGAIAQQAAFVRRSLQRQVSEVDDFVALLPTEYQPLYSLEVLADTELGHIVLLLRHPGGITPFGIAMSVKDAAYTVSKLCDTMRFVEGRTRYSGDIDPYDGDEDDDLEQRIPA